MARTGRRPTGFRRSQRLLIALVGIALGIGIGMAVAGLPSLDASRRTPVPIVVDAELLQPEGVTMPTSAETVVTEGEVPEETSGSEPSELLPRAELTVAVANGSGRTGVASRLADSLIELGYVDTAAVDTERSGASLVYFGVDHETDALRLALEIGLEPEKVRPIELAPAFEPDRPVMLLVVLGSDWNR